MHQTDDAGMTGMAVLVRSKVENRLVQQKNLRKSLRCMRQKKPEGEFPSGAEVFGEIRQSLCGILAMLALALHALR